ncbi:iron donor protein CyaY [Propionivibrio limicola]|uniref:iron donor protein CyaY n=1 Tax=Propionivibrio limicola TaxID=167645 RepID=UPI001290982A|nr:iron donor protein CyaY [Propionivibrio limicola]
MNESEFDALANAALARIEAALEKAVDESDADFDYAMVSAGVLEIEFEDGSKIIVNRHGAAQEIWVAARSGGFHFRWDGSAWRDTRDGGELMQALSRLVSAQAGVGLSLG